mmetsp:Transcript_43647/g.114714  ORF Transcript_43647/g.114714 Transcript_43647/m.114714 type:complete len:83 (+) Transcript_43647:212-460(+)
MAVEVVLAVRVEAEAIQVGSVVPEAVARLEMAEEAMAWEAVVVEEDSEAAMEAVACMVEGEAGQARVVMAAAKMEGVASGPD